MHTIGLIGGVASGKSAVAEALQRWGAVVFDADKIGHHILQRPEVRSQLVARWGDGILNGAGEIARSEVARLVFGDSPQSRENRKFLEQLLHPLIRAAIETDIRRLADAEVPAVVIDAPLLLESGWDAVCQDVLFVDVPRETRLARAQTQRHWTVEEFERREAAQMPIEEKRRRSTRVIPNAGTLAELDREVDRYWAAKIAR
jgi:dephospho-CoA kinase